MADDSEAKLYRELHPKVFRYFMGKLHNEEEAWDASSEVFRKFLDKVKNGDPIDSHSKYLFGSAAKYFKNLCRGRKVVSLSRKKKKLGEEKEKDDSYRKVRFFPLYVIDERIDERTDGSELVDNKLYAKDFIMALLEDEEGESVESSVMDICILYYIDQAGFEEIAEYMGMTVSVVEELFEKRHFYFMYFFKEKTLEEISDIKKIPLSTIHKRKEKIKKRIDELRREGRFETE